MAPPSAVRLRGMAGPASPFGRTKAFAGKGPLPLLGSGLQEAQPGACLADLATCLRVQVKSGKQMLGGSPDRGVPITATCPPLAYSEARGSGKAPNEKFATGCTHEGMRTKRPQLKKLPAPGCCSNSRLSSCQWHWVAAGLRLRPAAAVHGLGDGKPCCVHRRAGWHVGRLPGHDPDRALLAAKLHVSLPGGAAPRAPPR